MLVEMVMVSSSILRPKEVTEGAFSQAPDSLVAAPKSLALEIESGAFPTRASRRDVTSGLSHALCLLAAGPEGGDVAGEKERHIARVSPPHAKGSLYSRTGRIAWYSL